MGLLQRLLGTAHSIQPTGFTWFWCESDWRIKKVLQPWRILAPSNVGNNKRGQGHFFFFSSLLVSGGLTVYFKSWSLVCYVISGPLEGALEDALSRFINHGLGSYFFSRTRQLSHMTGGPLITWPDGNILAVMSMIFYLYKNKKAGHCVCPCLLKQFI